MLRRMGLPVLTMRVWLLSSVFLMTTPTTAQGTPPSLYCFVTCNVTDANRNALVEMPWLLPAPISCGQVTGYTQTLKLVCDGLPSIYEPLVSNCDCKVDIVLPEEEEEEGIDNTKTNATDIWQPEFRCSICGERETMTGNPNSMLQLNSTHATDDAGGVDAATVLWTCGSLDASLRSGFLAADPESCNALDEVDGNAIRERCDCLPINASTCAACGEGRRVEHPEQVIFLNPNWTDFTTALPIQCGFLESEDFPDNWCDNLLGDEASNQVETQCGCVNMTGIDDGTNEEAARSNSWKWFFGSVVIVAVGSIFVGMRVERRRVVRQRAVRTTHSVTSVRSNAQRMLSDSSQQQQDATVRPKVLAQIFPEQTQEGQEDNNLRFDSTCERYVFSKEAHGIDDEPRVCCICLDTIESTSIGGPCKHTYHRACILDWLHRNHDHCPICRDPMWDSKTYRQIQACIHQDQEAAHGTSSDAIEEDV